MRAPCSTPGCRTWANAGGLYCDTCDVLAPENWSRTRDAGWLAGKTTAEIVAIPLPDRKSSLLLIQGGKQVTDQSKAARK